MKLYRVDKRDFNVGDTLKTAGEFLQKNPAGSEVIESIFESVRPSNKPERAKCLYLFENIDVAKHHWSLMSDGKLYEVYLDCQDILHRADMRYVDLAFEATDESLRRKYAQDYWSGTETEKPRIEILTEKAVLSGVISKCQKERKEHLRRRALGI